MYNQYPAPRERWQTFENSWKRTQYLMSTLYFPDAPSAPLVYFTEQRYTIMLDRELGRGGGLKLDEEETD